MEHIDGTIKAASAVLDDVTNGKPVALAGVVVVLWTALIRSMLLAPLGGSTN